MDTSKMCESTFCPWLQQDGWIQSVVSSKSNIGGREHKFAQLGGPTAKTQSRTPEAHQERVGELVGGMVGALTHPAWASAATA